MTARARAHQITTTRAGRGRRRRLAAAALVAGVALSGLAACAGSGSDDNGASTAQVGPAAGVADSSGAKDASGGDRQGGDSSGAAGESSTGDTGAAAPGAVALQQRRQVRSGQLVVEVKDVDAAAANVRATVTAAQGYVQDEQTSTRPGPTSADDPTAVPVLEVDRSVLTLRVPQQSLDRVIEQVSGVGSVRARSQTSTDVTDQFVDTSSRVKSQKASVDRVRTLLGRATNIGDVVRLESELSQREANLDALEARLAALDDSTTFATLAVTLERPDAAVVQTTSNDGGFVGGLRDGWQALGDSAAVVLKIVGTLIPFAVLLALIGLPVWLVLRRRRTTTPPASA